MKSHLFVLLALAVYCTSVELSINNHAHADTNVTLLIKSMGFPVEQHNVVTKDGYILSVQRIPHGIKSGPSNAPKPAVFLQHGLLDASSTWVNNLPNESLAFILADQGYDVWLGNARGNRYSSGHTKLSTKSDSYWRFSYDEMALIDLPTMVAYALEKNGNHLLEAYIGHSQGTVMGFACFSSPNCSVDGMSNIGERVKSFVALAPAAFVGHIAAPMFKLLARTHVDKIFQWFGILDFMPSTHLLRELLPNLCDKHHPILETICYHTLCACMGCDSMASNLNLTRLPLYMNELPSGTSTQNIIHWSQAVEFDLFRKYDYGSAKANRHHYGTDKPPRYDLNTLDVDTLIYYGGQDKLADPHDVKDFIKLLPKQRLKKVSWHETYGHMDFVWSFRAARDIYEDVVDQLRNKL